MFTLALLVIITVYQEPLRGMAGQSYVGILLVCFILNAGVLVPSPSTAVVMTFASIYPPLPVAFLGGLGAAAGDLLSYFAGRSGGVLFPKVPQVQRVHGWVERYGGWAVLIAAFLPLPFFDLVAVSAGVLAMPVHRFGVPLLLGKVAKMLIYAYIGAGLLPMLEPYLRRVLVR